MKRVHTGLFLLMVFLFALPQAVSANTFTDPHYVFSIESAEAAQNSIETPDAVSSRVRGNSIKDMWKVDLNSNDITIRATEVIDLKWSPEEYPMDSVSCSKGTSYGSVKDTEEQDNLEYVVTPSNTTSGYISEVTFTLDTKAKGINSIADIYVEINAESDADIQVQMYDGSSWNTIRTIESPDDDISFSAGNDYSAKIRLYTDDDSPHEVEVDYIGMSIEENNLNVEYTLPDDVQIESIKNYRDSDIEIDYSTSGNTVTLDLSDYIDFDEKTLIASFTYLYNISFNEIGPTQQSPDQASAFSENITQTWDIQYFQEMRVSMPFEQDITLRAEPSIALTPNRVLIDDESIAFSIDNRGLEFEITEDCKIGLEYTLSDAISILPSYLYNQTSCELGIIGWESEYILENTKGVNLRDISLKHNSVDDTDIIAIITDPPTQIRNSTEDKATYIIFPELEEKVHLFIQEVTWQPIINCSAYTQVSDLITINEDPRFMTTIGVKNPSDKRIQLKLTESDVLTLLPLIEKGYIEGLQEQGGFILLNLDVNETSAIELYFTTMPLQKEEGSIKQHPARVGDPVMWSKEVRITNPSKLNYSQVRWETKVPEEVYDFLINNDADGNLGVGSLKYTESSIPANQTKEYTIIYYTPPIETRDTTAYSGILDNAIEKHITVTNPSNCKTTVKGVTGISDIYNPQIKEFAGAVSSYNLKKNENESRATQIEWTVTLEPYEHKTIILKGDKRDLNIDTETLQNSIIGLLWTIIPIAIPAILIIPALFIIRHIRHKRRKSMLRCISFIETLKKTDGNVLPSTTNKK